MPCEAPTTAMQNDRGNGLRAYRDARTESAGIARSSVGLFERPEAGQRGNHARNGDRWLKSIRSDHDLSCSVRHGPQMAGFDVSKQH